MDFIIPVLIYLGCFFMAVALGSWLISDITGKSFKQIFGFFAIMISSAVIASCGLCLFEFLASPDLTQEIEVSTIYNSEQILGDLTTADLKHYEFISSLNDQFEPGGKYLAKIKSMPVFYALRKNLGSGIIPAQEIIVSINDE